MAVGHEVAHLRHGARSLDLSIMKPTPATEAQVSALEARFGYALPLDYRHFLTTQGSLREFIGECFLDLMPVDQIVPINEAGEIQERFPGALVIGGDGSRELLTYDFRGERGSLVLLDITAEDWSAAIPQAPSLTAFLEQFPVRGWYFGNDTE